MPRDIDFGISKFRDGGCGWFERDPFADYYALRMLRIAPLSRDFAKAAAQEPYFCEVLGFDPDGPAPSVREISARIDECTVALLGELDPQGSALHRNICSLADALGLDHTETEVLRFALLLHANPVIEMVLDAVRSPIAGDPYFCTAHACGLPIDAVKAALSPRGTLHTSGLVQVDRNGRADMNLKSRLDVMMRFGLVLSSDAFSPEDLLGQCAAVAPASTLSGEDFQHLGDHADLVQRLLAVALERRERGINVLLWGPPGTGKTEFARLLADRVGCTVREVVSDDAEGDAVGPTQRGAVLAIAQRLLEDRADTVLVFDEMEDLLGARSRYQLRGAAHGKAWLNRLLETNPVPTVWISNDADHFDPAILRRFSYVVKLGVLPTDARRRVIARHLDGLRVADELVEQLANAESLPPACIGHAARVARLLEGHTDPTDAVRRVIGGATDLLRVPKSKARPKSPVPYDLRYANADTDLRTLTGRIKRVGTARLCLYGPPGTGKSEFGRELARNLGRPLIVRRASDILGMYVGQTEHNLARAFAEATAKNAVLLVDEADSFVYSRAEAVRSWERWMVNEFLTQMEDFDGILICSTNLPHALDEASARRFDLQIRFEPLNPRQAWALFKSVARSHAVKVPRKDEAMLRLRVQCLPDLTPGDFAKAVRGGRLTGALASADALVAMLERVVASKHAGRSDRPIGFVH